jgi:hypothetical protein
MRKIHCNGCGMTEELDSPNGTIKAVTFAEDDWQARSYEADLCPDCRARLLHNYFGISARGELETPAFIEPQSSKIARR